MCKGRTPTSRGNPASRADLALARRLHLPTAMRRLLPVLLLALTPAGCSMWDTARTNPGAGGVGAATGGLDTGLPCDVNQVLQDNCRACHGALPLGGAPMSLVTYADLMAPARSDPSKRVADLCLTRMQDAASPMPPSPAAMPAADVATFQAWLAAGAPMGDCRAGPDPLNAAPTCTSGSFYSGGDDGSSRMNPGQACISCHQSHREGPRFSLAGTVFPTGHEPDLCFGAPASSGAQIVITDANGQTLTLTPNAAGNFYSETAIALPYQAKVVANGATRAMSAAQTSGDCNSCHTQSGANGAPGRITLP